jgi:hypothetical protein
MPRSSRHVKGSSKLQKLNMPNFEVEFENDYKSVFLLE